jgi:hypothetical protein
MWSCPQRVVAAEPGQVGHQDRVGGLVELVAAGVRRGLAVEQRVARDLAGRQLLLVEQELGLGARGGQVAVGQEAGERLVGVAGEDLPVRAVVDRLAVHVLARVDRLAPRGRERGDDRAGERLVLAGLQHVRVEVVGLGDGLLGLAGHRGGGRLSPGRRRARCWCRPARCGNDVRSDAVAVWTDCCCVRPKPRARVNSPPARGVTFSVATMCPSAAEVVCVSAYDESSWVSPSLAVPS